MATWPNGHVRGVHAEYDLISWPHPDCHRGNVRECCTCDSEPATSLSVLLLCSEPDMTLGNDQTWTRSQWIFLKQAGLRDPQVEVSV